MKIILMEDVKTLGKKGEIVSVSDAYGRNVLLAKNLAVEATKTNLNDLKLKNQQKERMEAENLKNAKELAAKLEELKIEVKIKTGENGKAFGSVSSKEISTAAKEQLDLDLDKKKIQLSEPIKSLGMHEVAIRLHPKVTGILKVHVDAE